MPQVKRLRHWWNSPDQIPLMVPDWYAPHQPDWPPQAVQLGFPSADRFGDASELPADLAAFLDAGGGAPPLAFTYGSAMRADADSFAMAVRLCRRIGRRGVPLARQDGQIPADLPPDVIHVAYAPFSALPPRCAALVHHGGIGTVAQALAAGIPQPIVPMGFTSTTRGAWASATSLTS